MIRNKLNTKGLESSVKDQEQCKTLRNSVKQYETVTDTGTFDFQLLSKTFDFFTPPFITRIFTPVGNSLH